MNLEQRTYTSSNNYNFIAILRASLKGFINSFYLAKQLAKRDIKAQHRQSIFGVFWVIAPVLFNTLVWVFLQGSGTISLTPAQIPYPLFVVLGTMFWSIISECINLPMNSINANKSIITKINFDKEALISLGLLKFWYNFLLKLAIILFFVFYYRIVPSVSIIMFVPLLCCSVVFFVSIGVLIAPLGMLYHDISKMIPIVLQALMYATPVVYVTPKTGFMKTIMSINPLSYWMTDLKNIMTGFAIEYPVFWVVFTLTTLLLSLLALVVYRVSMPILTERMSA